MAARRRARPRCRPCLSGPRAWSDPGVCAPRRISGRPDIGDRAVSGAWEDATWCAVPSPAPSAPCPSATTTTTRGRGSNNGPPPALRASPPRAGRIPPPTPTALDRSAANENTNRHRGPLPAQKHPHHQPSTPARAPSPTNPATAPAPPPTTPTHKKHSPNSSPPPPDTTHDLCLFQTEDGFELVECAPGLGVVLCAPTAGATSSCNHCSIPSTDKRSLYSLRASRAFGGNQDSVPSHHPRRAMGGRGQRRPRAPCSKRSTLRGGRVQNRRLCQVRQGFGLFELRTLHWVEVCHRDRRD